LDRLEEFFATWAKLLLPALVPGANVVVASNPLLSHIVSGALARGGLERRGEIVRLVMTMRGGDRPKHAHEEFSDVSVMPRSMWEPWLLFRKPLEGRVQDNLRKWKTGGFRRVSEQRPFGDVIASAPTRKREREIAPHPSLKPQAFLRQIVRASLPLGEGVVLDPFAGSGSTLAAGEAVGYESLGVEQDPLFFEMAQAAFGRSSFKDAATLARAASHSPEDAVRGEAFVLLGESELKQRRHAAAVTAFKSAAEAPALEPALRYRALAGTGLAYEEQRQWAQAAKFYDEVASKSPDKTLASWAKERLAAVHANLKADHGAAKPAPKAPAKGSTGKSSGGQKTK
jgi:hypothetical protein